MIALMDAMFEKRENNINTCIAGDWDWKKPMSKSTQLVTTSVAEHSLTTI